MRECRRPEENPYLPPRATALAERTTAATPHSAREWLLVEGGLAQGAALVFTLLGLFTLIGLGETALRLVAVQLVGYLGHAAALTTVIIALAVAELAAQCTVMVLLLRRRPRARPVALLGLVLWILVCVLGPPLNSTLGSLATILIARLPSQPLRDRVFAMSIVRSAALLGRGILVGLGLLLAFLRWRRVDRQLGLGHPDSSQPG